MGKVNNFKPVTQSYEDSGILDDELTVISYGSCRTLRWWVPCQVVQLLKQTNDKSVYQSLQYEVLFQVFP